MLRLVYLLLLLLRAFLPAPAYPNEVVCLAWKDGVDGDFHLCIYLSIHISRFCLCVFLRRKLATVE